MEPGAVLIGIQASLKYENGSGSVKDFVSNDIENKNVDVFCR